MCARARVCVYVRERVYVRHPNIPPGGALTRQERGCLLWASPVTEALTEARPPRTAQALQAMWQWCVWSLCACVYVCVLYVCVLYVCVCSHVCKRPSTVKIGRAHV